jgi:hypothetical protein
MRFHQLHAETPTLLVPGSKVSLDRAIETAQRSDTIVYSILFSDKDAYDNGGFGGPHMGGGGPWGGHRGGMGGGDILAAVIQVGAAAVIAVVPSRRQKSAAAPCTGNRRTLLRGFQKRTYRRHLQTDIRGTAQSIQHRLHARSRIHFGQRLSQHPSDHHAERRLTPDSRGLLLRLKLSTQALRAARS